MRKRLPMTMAICAAVGGIALPVGPAGRVHAQVVEDCTAIFDFTGVEVEFVVPDGIDVIRVDIYGAAGGDATGGTGVPNISEGGFGAGATGGELAVAAGDVMTVIVGQEGGPAVADESFNPGGVGGYGYDGTGGGQSGGNGGNATINHGGGGGGGASAVLNNGTLVASAGGGGGGSHGGPGGDGGQVGSPGQSSGTAPANAPGGGATNVVGGGAGTGSRGGSNGVAGASGVGGRGGDAIDTQAGSGGGDAGGGGGGGTFGGGGAGGGEATEPGGGAGGGGGSSFASLGNYETGVRDGDGRVLLTLVDGVCPGDIGITKAVSNAAPEIGEEIVYTLVATNNGPTDPANGVVVTDNFPAGVTYVSDDCGGVNAERWTWDIGELAIDTPVTCNITVLVEDPGTWTNTASITGTDPDGNPDNNEASIDISVAPQDYELEIVKDGVIDAAGRQITYTLTASNLGPDPTYEIVYVADVLPAQVAYVSDTCGGVVPPNRQPATGTLWIWIVGEMAVGQTDTCDITVDVLDSGTITNRAIIGGHSSLAVEATLQNNEDDVTLEFPTQVDLTIEKSASPTAATVGGQVTYTLTARNLGPDDATGVVVTDPLPAQTTYVSSTCGAVNSPPWTWTIGALAAGATATCNITVTVNAVGTIVNTATVDATESETVETNNTDNADVQAAAAPPPVVTIPRTGSGLEAGTSSVAVLLVGLGGVLLVVARSRRRHT